MGRVERQLSHQGEDRKSLLLERAEELLLERGYAATRMRDVAEAAGVTKGLLYWYFESKEALFREIIADIRNRMRAAIIAAAADFDDRPLDQIYAGTAAAVRFAAEHRRMYDLVHSVDDFADARLIAAQRDAEQTAVALLAGQQQGALRSDQPALLLARLNAGVVTEAANAVAQGTPVEQAAHAAAGYVVRALAASEIEADRVLAANSPPRRRTKRRR